MRKIDALLSEYGEKPPELNQQSDTLDLCSAIFFSIVGLIASIPSGLVQSVLGEGNPYANWATITLIIVTAYYISLSISLTVGMALFGVLCIFLVRIIAETGSPLWLVSIIIFVVAWIGQFYGHKVEGKKPSFFKDIQFLLIGPAWLMHFIYKKIGIPY